MSPTNSTGSQEPKKPRGRRSSGNRLRLLKQVFSNPTAEFTTKEIMSVIASLGGPERQGVMYILNKWEDADLIQWSEGLWQLTPQANDCSTHTQVRGVDHVR